MMIEKRKPGRPRKVISPIKSIPISVPSSCKVELDKIKEELSDRLGFAVSNGDAILYLIHNRKNSSGG